jgi:hypothetical protein
MLAEPDVPLRPAVTRSIGLPDSPTDFVLGPRESDPAWVNSRISDQAERVHVCGTVPSNESKSRVMIQSRLSMMDTRKPMDAQTIAIDAVVTLTGGNREAVTALIQKLYMTGVKDPKRLTFKGLQAAARI